MKSIDDKKYQNRPGAMSFRIGSSLPMLYQIRLKGHLSTQWADWFGGLDILLADSGETLLTGQVADQAALFGLLRKVRDLGLPLLSVIWLNPD